MTLVLILDSMNFIIDWNDRKRKDTANKDIKSIVDIFLLAIFTLAMSKDE